MLTTRLAANPHSNARPTSEPVRREKQHTRRQSATRPGRRGPAPASCLTRGVRPTAAAAAHVPLPSHGDPTAQPGGLRRWPDGRVSDVGATALPGTSGSATPKPSAHRTGETACDLRKTVLNVFPVHVLPTRPGWTESPPRPRGLPWGLRVACGEAGGPPSPTPMREPRTFSRTWKPPFERPSTLVLTSSAMTPTLEFPHEAAPHTAAIGDGPEHSPTIFPSGTFYKKVWGEKTQKPTSVALHFNKHDSEVQVR